MKSVHLSYVPLVHSRGKLGGKEWRPVEGGHKDSMSSPVVSKKIARVHYSPRESAIFLEQQEGYDYNEEEEARERRTVKVIKGRR